MVNFNSAANNVFTHMHNNTITTTLGLFCLQHYRCCPVRETGVTIVLMAFRP